MSEEVQIKVDDSQTIFNFQDEEDEFTEHSSPGHEHCKHGHHHHGKKKKGKKHKWFDKYSLQIKIFVYGSITGGWALIFFWFCEPFKDEPVNYWASKIFITIFVAMSLFSYYRCSTAYAGNPSKFIPPWATESQTTCNQCGKWKPDRVHHCSACNDCILRMDHHCPWICACVGYKNHKAFWLFCFYTGISGLFYDYRALYYFLIGLTNSEHSITDHSVFFYIFWLYESIAILPVGLAVVGLTLYHFGLAMNNLTTLESMGGLNFRTCCESQASLEKKVANKYDRGFLANLSEFFGDNPLLWLWPTLKETNYYGQVFEKSNPPTKIELYKYSSESGQELTPEEKLMRPNSLEDVDLRKIFELAEDFTKDKHLQFLDKMFEIGKRQDNTYGTNTQQNVRLYSSSNDMFDVTVVTSPPVLQQKESEIPASKSEQFSNPVIKKTDKSTHKKSEEPEPSKEAVENHDEGSHKPEISESTERIEKSEVSSEAEIVERDKDFNENQMQNLKKENSNEKTEEENKEGSVVIVSPSKEENQEGHSENPEIQSEKPESHSENHPETHETITTPTDENQENEEKGENHETVEENGEK